MTLSLSVSSAIILHVAFFYCYAECRYAKCHFAECLGTGLISVVKIELILQFCKVAFSSSQPSLIFVSNAIVKRAPLG
jgi:hypothetical protein